MAIYAVFSEIENFELFEHNFVLSKSHIKRIATASSVQKYSRFFNSEAITTLRVTSIELKSAVSFMKARFCTLKK